MPNLESAVNPCPSCGKSRATTEAPCKGCGWAPAPSTEARTQLHGPELSMSAAGFLGFLTILPMVYVAAFLAWMVYITMGMPNNGQAIGSLFSVVFCVHILMMILVVCLLIWYIYFLFNTPLVQTEYKALWAVVLFFGGAIAMIVFWYLYIWKPLNEARYAK